MQFSATFIAATAALLSVASADGIFAMKGKGTIADPSTLYLQVLNGLVGEPPKCEGTVQFAALPAGGSIPCTAEGYSLTWTWNFKEGAVAATYATPSSPAFEYNVPNLGGDGVTYEFGFENLFPEVAGKVIVPFRA